MLGKPSLQYRIQRLLSVLVSLLLSRFNNSWSVVSKNFNTKRSYMGDSLVFQALDSAGVAVNTIIAFILAMIATIIGVNLIGPVATAVGGALKNGNLTGAANSLTAQITLLFVVVVILGVVIFIAVLGKMAAGQAE